MPNSSVKKTLICLTAQRLWYKTIRRSYT